MTSLSINYHVAIAAVMLTAFVLQSMLVVMVPELRRRWWSAAITLMLFVYAASLVAQMVVGRTQTTVIADRVTFAAIVIVVPLLHGMVQTYIGDSRRRWLYLMLAVHLAVAIAGIFLPWFSSDEFRLRRVGYFSPRMYWEADGGPLQLPLIGYLFVVVTAALYRWARHTWRSPATPRWYLIGFLVWYVMSIQNAVVNVVAPSAPGLLSWGFVVFALFTLATTVAETRVLHRVAREAEAETRGILRSSANPIVSLSPNLTVRYGNPAFTSLFPGTVDYADRAVLSIVDPSDRRRFRAAVAEATGNPGEPLTIEARFQAHDGTVRPMQCAIVTTAGAEQRPGRVVLTLVDLTEHKKREAESRFQALHDPLTRLFNRLALDMQLKSRLEDEADGWRDREWALLLLDIDGFKAMNDTYGHSVGDEILVAVARRIAEAVRNADACYRLGGDEFVVLTDELGSPDDAMHIARRIGESVAVPVTTSDGTIAPRASIGVAVYPDHGRTAALLMKHADLAMYDAKESAEGPRIYHDQLIERRRALR